MKNIKLSTILIVLAPVLLLGYFFTLPKGLDLSGQPFYGTTENTSSTVTTAHTLILPANSGRRNAVVCHDSLSTNARLYITEIAAADTPTTTIGQTGYFVAGTGIALDKGECYEYGGEFVPTGDIYGIATTTIVSTAKQSTGR